MLFTFCLSLLLLPLFVILCEWFFTLWMIAFYQFFCHVLLQHATLINLFLPLFDVDKGGENADMHKLRGSITRICHHQKGGVCERILYFELIFNDSKLCDHHPNVGCALHFMIYLCSYFVLHPTLLLHKHTYKSTLKIPLK